MNESLSEKIELALSKLTEFLECSAQSIKKEKEEFEAFLLIETEKLKNGFDDLKAEEDRIEAERIEYEENEAARIEAERIEGEIKLPKAEQKEKRARV